MRKKRQPDRATRLLSHAFVGIAAGVVVGRRAGIVGFTVAAFAGSVAHELFDAPVADLLADAGL
jgi:hypothetical protein